MTIKDFTPGQTVYALSRVREKITHHTIRRYMVISVGRKYVKVAPADFPDLTTEFYKLEEDAEYLTERKDWGNPMRLFLTEAAANDDIEADMLRSWFRKATEHYRIEEYTLEQLRAVKRILEAKERTVQFHPSAKRILLRLHEAGGCDAQDDYSKGWDEAITEAIRIVETETGIKIGEVLD